MQKVRWLFLLGFLFIVPMANAQDYEPEFEVTECPFGEVDGVECGYLYAPEDRNDPEGTWVELAVAIINFSDNPDPIPVIYLEGGPGGAPLIAADSWFEHPLLENHTLILFDQRGTGFSYPSLNCYEIEEETSDDPVAECRDRLLDEGVNLQAYNSKNSADDIADLVTTLGYDTVNLYGISYGTKLALTTMREHPEIINSVVIDSVYPPENDDTAENSLYAYQSMDLVFEECANDANCSAAYPGLQDNFIATINELNETPQEFELETEDGSFEAQEIYGDDILGSFFQALYDTSLIPYLPYALDLISNPQSEDDFLAGLDVLDGLTPDADEGDFGEESLADSSEVTAFIEEFGDISDSEGMNYSVDCQEEYLQGDYDAAIQIAESAPEPYPNFFLTSVEQTQADCENWGVDPSDPIETERVVSDLPILIFSGGFDPITPPSSGESALQGMSNGRHLVFPSAGHGITGGGGGDHGACAVEIMLAFLADNTADLDTSCIQATTPIDWYVE